MDPSALDAGAIGFRLAPRINAAGRLHRADAGLELLLTEDPARARAIAAELDAVNAERRDVETRILFAAEAQVAEHGPAPAYVLAGEGWHPGVIGIVAARIAERHHRPAVLIALDGDEGTGSGRSIPAFDLLGGLTASRRHLDRYGGHRAAAGLTIARDAVDAFRESFCAHAAEVLTPEDLVPQVRIDAVVPGDVLTLALAEELERLAPFGHGNPPVSLLVPAAQLADPRAMGEGRHVAFTLHAGGARSRCVQFGAGSRLPAGPDEPVEPPSGSRRTAGTAPSSRAWCSATPAAAGPRRSTCSASPRSRDGVAAELAPRPRRVGGRARDAGRRRRPRRARRRHRRPARRPRRRRRAGARGRRARAAPRARAARTAIGGFAICSWAALEDDPDLAAGFAHLVAVDPPSRPGCAGAARTSVRAGDAHLAWGEPELRFAQRIHEWDFALRDPLTALYRALRAAGGGPRGGPRGRAPGRGAAAEVRRARGAPGAGPLGARSGGPRSRGAGPPARRDARAHRARALAGLPGLPS